MRPPTGFRAAKKRTRFFRAVMFGCGLALSAAAAPAQEAPSTATTSDLEQRATTLGEALRGEARRYLSDSLSILRAPLHWDLSQWERAGVLLAGIAILAREDGGIAAQFQSRRSSATDSFSRVLTPFGSTAAIAFSGGALGAGLIRHDAALREMGRDAVEAEVLAAGIATPLLKTAVGRLRPSQGSDADEFRALSGNQSFPSGHATEAFAVASVVAARSSGWVVPAVAYTLASGVAVARVNDRAHFASDVAAGAVVGTLIGRSVVARHRAEASERRAVLVPIAGSRGGIGLGLTVDLRRP